MEDDVKLFNSGIKDTLITVLGSYSNKCSCNFIGNPRGKFECGSAQPSLYITDMWLILLLLLFVHK